MPTGETVLAWSRRIALAAAVLLVAGVAGAFLFVGTQTGRDAVARLAENALSDDSTTVRIAAVTGNLASAFRIGELSVADADGRVIIAEDVAVDWHPVSLLSGTLDIETFDIGRVSLAGFGKASGGSTASAGTALPPLAIRIAALSVREIALDETVLGEAQLLSLAGSLSAQATPVRLAVKARLARTDRGSGHADVDVAYTARPAQFAARIDIEEPAGGLLARLAGLPADAPLSVQLKGDGPPDRWRGRLAARAGTLAALNADITVALADSGGTLSLDGEASASALLPPSVRPLAAPSVRLRAAIDHAADGAVTLKELTASSGTLSARVRGRYDPARGTVSGTFSVAGVDGLSLPELAPGVAVDGATLEGALDGTVAQPSLSVRLAARRLALPGVTAAGVAGQVRLAVAADRPMAAAGNIRAETLDTGGAVPAGLLGSSVEIGFDAAIRPDGTAQQVDVTIGSGSLTVKAAGAMSGPDAIEGTYTLTHSALGDFFAGTGLPLRAAGDATGDFRADLASGQARLGFAGALTGIAAPDPWISALAGPRTAFSGSLTVDGDGTVRLAGLDIASDAAGVQGAATIPATADRLEARYTATLPDLGPLSRAAGVALAGAVQATGTVKGALRSPDLTVQVATHRLAIEGMALGNVGAGLAARPTTDGFRAAVRLGGDLAGKPLSGDLGVVARKTVLQLQRAKLSVGRNSVAGDLTVDTARSRLTGDATLTLADARDVPPVAGLPAFASGTGTVRLVLRHDKGQTLDVEAALKALALADGDSASVSVENATGKVTLRDPFAAFSADGTVRLAGLRAAGTALSKAEATVKGDRSSLSWTLSADGARPVPLSLKSDGTLALAAQDISVRVARLDGRIADHTVRLRAPASVRLLADGLTSGPIDLAVGGGAIRLRADTTRHSLDVTGEIDSLPLAVASLAAPELDLSGTLSGKMRLAGRAPVPSIDATLTATGIRPADLGPEEFAGAVLEATLTQDASGARVALKLQGPDGTAADGSVRTSPLVGLGPLRLLDGKSQELSGKFEARAKLDLLNYLVALGEDRLAGRLEASVTVAGTVAQPVVKGTARLSDGAYEGAATGAVLRDAVAQIEFDGDRARLVSLTATDGNGGRLAGSGLFAFEPGESVADRLTVTLERFTALRRPEAEIVATGAVTLAGPLDAPAVAGKLRVERGELRIPDRLPQDVVDLEVEEINRPAAATASDRRAEPSASRSLPVALDLAIDFPGKTFVRGRGLESEWKGALTVKGTSAEPAISGKLSVVRGTFAFAGKTFVLKNGSVSFTGPGMEEPEIDATAEAKLNTLVAQIQISGKLSKPSLAVTSDPPMPQEEVLAHILFGRTTGQLSAIQAAQLAQTAATLSGKGGGANIVDRVRQTLGVDVLNVETGEGGTGASLKAGKYVTEDVFLSVTQGTEPGSQKVGVEVEVLPNLSVESDISGTASSNVGVNWKFDY